MSASRAEKSAGSSAGAASFCDAAWALDSSRAALPPFLRREGVVVKERRAEKAHCWRCGWVVVSVEEVCLREVLIGRVCHCRSERCVIDT